MLSFSLVLSLILFLLGITIGSISLPTSTTILAHIMAVKFAMSSK